MCFLLEPDIIIVHVPIEISKVVWNFVEHSGGASCEVTGATKLGNGLEVPCNYIFTGSKKLIKKLIFFLLLPNRLTDGQTLMGL